MQKIAMDVLVVSVGQACNLKCKNCGNLVPQSPPESKRHDIEGIIADFERLWQALEKIRILQIQGGEPFLYSDLSKLVAYLGACKEIGIIEVATNGTIMPDEYCWHILSLNRVCLRISNYKQDDELLSAIIEKARRYHLYCYTYNFKNADASWNYLGGVLDSYPPPGGRG